MFRKVSCPVFNYRRSKKGLPRTLYITPVVMKRREIQIYYLQSLRAIFCSCVSVLNKAYSSICEPVTFYLHVCCVGAQDAQW